MTPVATNGQLPASDLAYIPGTSERVLASLLAQTVALRAAFAHRFGRALTVTDAYRTLAEQVAIFLARYTTSYAASAKIDRRVWNGRTWWRKPGFASAATPGTSVHGWARAIDFGSGVNILGSPEQKWMVANAPRFGWYWPTLYRSAPYLEPWHYEGTAVALASYAAYLSEHGITVPDLTLPANLTPTRSPTMRVIKSPDRPENFITDGVTKRYIQTTNHQNDLFRLCGQTEPMIVGQDTLDAIPDWTPTGSTTVDIPALAAAIAAAIPEQTPADTGDLVAAFSEALRDMTWRAS